MIPSIPNPPMSSADIRRFRERMARHLRGEFSAEERELASENARKNKAIYDAITANNGGKNPILNR